MIRLIVLIVFFIGLASSVVINDWVWFLYYQTYWSVNFSMISFMATSKAAIKGQDSVWFKFACISQEIMMGFNFTTTVMFWLILAPSIFPYIDWHDPMSVFTGVRMVTLHAVPMIASIVNLAITDMTFQRQDWKYVFYTGMAYIPANAIGTFMMGAPLYPLVDWKNIPETIGLFTLQAIVQALFYIFVCWCQTKCGGKK